MGRGRRFFAGLTLVIIPVVAAGTEVKSGRLEFSRIEAVEKESSLVNEAYRAYQSGDVATARSKYAEALQAYPDNRDAMLGLAACAVNEGNLESAVAMYSHLTRVYPQDELPRAALIGLQRQQDSMQEEAVIRNMLSRQPEIPFLHFILGRLYATQSRWPEAQQAFFAAHRFDPATPGYALNLAISLDRLGQSETALHYYHVAIDLAEQGASDFDTAPIIDRINSLFRQIQP